MAYFSTRWDSKENVYHSVYWDDHDECCYYFRSNQPYNYGAGETPEDKIKFDNSFVFRNNLSYGYQLYNEVLSKLIQDGRIEIKFPCYNPKKITNKRKLKE